MSKKLEDLINSMSPEEQEFHKDLIKECRQRELSLDKSSKESIKNLEKLIDTFTGIFKSINDIDKYSEEMNNIKIDKSKLH